MTLHIDTPEANALEAMIDKHNLHEVLWLVATIASAKANHIEENWQDRTLARQWSAASRTIEKCAESKAVISLP